MMNQERFLYLLIILFSNLVFAQNESLFKKNSFKQNKMRSVAASRPGANLNTMKDCQIKCGYSVNGDNYSFNQKIASSNYITCGDELFKNDYEDKLKNQFCPYDMIHSAVVELNCVAEFESRETKVKKILNCSPY